MGKIGTKKNSKSLDIKIYATKLDLKIWTDKYLENKLCTANNIQEAIHRISDMYCRGTVSQRFQKKNVAKKKSTLYKLSLNFKAHYDYSKQK